MSGLWCFGNRHITKNATFPFKVYGGKDDLTAAMGYEEGGVTTVAFRRKLAATEPSDHPIDNGLFQVWWSDDSYFFAGTQLVPCQIRFLFDSDSGSLTDFVFFLGINSGIKAKKNGQ